MLVRLGGMYIIMLLYLLVHEFMFASEVPSLEVEVLTYQLILALNEEKIVLLMFGLNAFVIVRGKGKLTIKFHRCQLV